MSILLGIGIFVAGFFIGIVAMAVLAASGLESAREEGMEIGWDAAIQKMQKIAKNSMESWNN